MGDEHGRARPAPRWNCEEPSAPAGSPNSGLPARADVGNADGSGAGFSALSSHSSKGNLGFWRSDLILWWIWIRLWAAWGGRRGEVLDEDLSHCAQESGVLLDVRQDPAESQEEVPV